MVLAWKCQTTFIFLQYYACVTACGSKENSFFLQITASSRNIVLGAMCKLYYNDLQKLVSTYLISSLNASNTDIKMAIWRHFNS